MSSRASTSKKAASEKKPPLTHFLCIPLVTPTSQSQLETSLRSFRDNVASMSPNTSYSQVPAKAIRPTGTLHFTLGVMSLNEDELVAAIDLLRSSEVTDRCMHQATDSSKNLSPLRIDLRGLVSMHPPQSTSILYAEPVDASQRFYSICVLLRDLFRSKGFLVPDDRPLKLHAIIVNTIYAKGNPKPTRQKLDTTVPGPAAGKHEDRAQGHGPNAKAPIKLDARNLVESYKDHVWASDVHIDRLSICEMGAKKVLDADGKVVEEKYTEVANVRLST